MKNTPGFHICFFLGMLLWPLRLFLLFSQMQTQGERKLLLHCSVIHHDLKYVYLNGTMYCISLSIKSRANKIVSDPGLMLSRSSDFLLNHVPLPCHCQFAWLCVPATLVLEATVWAAHRPVPVQHYVAQPYGARSWTWLILEDPFQLGIFYTSLGCLFFVFVFFPLRSKQTLPAGVRDKCSFFACIL